MPDLSVALTEIEAALEAATPGPWLVHKLDVYDDGRTWEADAVGPLVGVWHNDDTTGIGSDNPADAALIVLLRNNAAVA